MMVLQSGFMFQAFCKVFLGELESHCETAVINSA